MNSLREQAKTRTEICKVHNLVTGEMPNWLWVPLEVAEVDKKAELDLLLTANNLLIEKIDELEEKLETIRRTLVELKSLQTRFCDACNYLQTKPQLTRIIGEFENVLSKGSKDAKELGQPVDPDELQHLDELNMPWRNAWKKEAKNNV